MRRRRCSNIFLSVLINFLINLDSLIFIFVFLFLHFAFGWPIWIFWALLGMWIIGIVLRSMFFQWASDCANSQDAPKENKNPYSKKTDDILHKKQD